MNKTKNFRRRTDEDDDDDDDGNDQSKENNAVPKSQKNQKSIKDKSSNRAPGSNLLSFAGDEDQDIVARKDKKNQKPKSKPSPPVRNLLSFDSEDQDAQVFQKPKKKPGLGAAQAGSAHKLSAGKERGTTATHSIPSNLKPQAGEYTEERFAELRKNTRPLGGLKPQPPQESAKTSSLDTVVVLKGLVKPSVAEEDTGVEENLEEFRREKDAVQSRLGAVGIEPATSVSIPDQAKINRARAMRESFRQAQAAPDYIPLVGVGTGGKISGELLEDGDSSDDECEIHGRLAMVGDKPIPNPNSNLSEVKKGVFEVVDSRGRIAREDGHGHGDEDDEDDEERRWEEEQFRKGFGKRVDDAVNRVSVAPVAVATTSMPVGVAGSFQPTGYTAPNWTLGNISRSAEVMSMSQQAEIATRALQENLQRLRENHDRTKSDLYRVDENLSYSLETITNLEKSLKSAGEKYIFMQQMRDFIGVLCDFLQHKAPYIEELEEQMQRLHEERATAIVERRMGDDADEMAEVEAGINAAKSVFSKGGSATTAAAAAAAAQAAATAARDGSNLPPQADEFGRDVNWHKRNDLKRRIEARKQRRERAASKRAANLTAANGTANQYIEGESSSDESDTDCKAYQSSRFELIQTAEQVFGDAAEEFSQLSSVKERFEEWKSLYSSAYRDAYMTLSAPAIFSPYVRLELLKWDPLYEDADLNSMQWHTLLFDYGIPKNTEDFESVDADADLVPGLVEKVALPILHHEVAHCWDQLSTRGTKNAVAAVQVIVNYVPASNKALEELFAVVHMRLDDAVKELQVPTWSIPLMNAVSQAARIAAYKFGMSVRLLRNIALWKDILEMRHLEQLALDALLCGKILPHLRIVVPNIYDAITRTERVVAAISGVWTVSSFSVELSHKLLPLAEYITTLGKELEKKQSLGARPEDTMALARRLKKMLVELNEYDKARRILKTFQLKEAL